jgi:hypothetical protein
MKTLLRTHRFLRLMLVILLAGLLVVFGERLDKAHAVSMVTVTRCPSEKTLIADIGTAGSGGTVRFSIKSPCTISINPTLVISQNLTLDNNGQQVTLDGRRLAQVLLVNPHVIFTLNALTIGNGRAGDGGGLLANTDSTVNISNSTFAKNSAQFGGGLLANANSTVRISNSTFTNNSAQFGGGILANANSTVRISNSTFAHNSNSTFAKNSAQFGGGLLADSGSTVGISNSTFTNNSAQFGGLFAHSGSTVNISNSTFAHNSAQFGGGLLADSGSTVGISNSTFAHNSAQFGGGLLANANSTVNISNSTFANNSATKGGGFFNSVGRLRIGQSIVANNTPGGNCSPSGSITDTGYNLSNDTSCGFTAANHSVPNTNPKLDPAGLKNNGGPTQTIALLSGSPAIDQIPSAVCLVATDQRGFPRPDNNESVCDIGAYEHRR